MVEAVQVQSTRKIKVVHVYKDFDTYNGLIETFLFLAKYHDRGRFELGLCVFNYKGGEYGRNFRDLGGKLYNLNCGNGVKGYLNTFVCLNRFLKQQKPDIVVTHDRRGNFIGIPSAKIAGIPLIVSTETTLKDSATTIIRRVRDRIVHPILWCLVLWSDAFVGNSKIVRTQWMFKRQASKFRVIYPPFNLEKYQKIIPAGTQPKGGSDHFPTLGYIGRLSEEKGLHYLINALSIVNGEFPGVRLLVAGTGEMECAYKALVKEKHLDDRVSFLGFQQNTFETLRKIDLLIVPSRTEGFGVAALEGMAMGVPVIASRVGGLNEIISEDAGVLVPPKDVEALAEAIINLLSHREKMHRMGRAGYNRAFTVFNPQRYVQQFEHLYAELLKIRYSNVEC
jgi:glycosyltransferase involved in cell wall biosynthesis